MIESLAEIATAVFGGPAEIVWVGIEHTITALERGVSEVIG